MARKEKKDRTSLIISTVIHIILIGAVGYWAHKSGQLEKMRQVLLRYAGQKKEQKKELPKQVAQPPSSAKLPPINQGLPQKASTGTRRAVAVDAPAAAGDTFFQDTRKQVQGPSTGGAVGAAVAPAPKVIPPPPPPPPPFKAAAPSTIKTLLAERAKAAASTESFGSEQISKSGVSDAGDIVNKVAGASVVDGKFAVIRGLSERYVTTTLNGAEVPSADPYRRSASLDLFPSQIIEKVVIAKTFTPDQPGSYTGGGINIVTKSFPERPFFSASIGGSYNTQATFNKDYLSYPGGSFDWVAMDDGSRALPPELAEPSLIIPNAPFYSGLPDDPNYTMTVANANRLQALTRSMGVARFAPERDKAPLNHNFSITGGDTTHLLTHPFGYFAGLTYNRSFSFYMDAISRRYKPAGKLGTFDIRKNSSDTRAVEDVNWAGVVNLAYQLHDDHELGFNFLYNQNSEDLARRQRGTTTDEEGSIFHLNRLHFTERNLSTYQVKGLHRFPALADLRLDWLGAISTTSQDEPDTRFFNFREYQKEFSIGQGSIPTPKQPTRYFRDLDEQNRNVKFDLTLPFRQWFEKQGEFKVGAFDSFSDRTFTDREIFYQKEDEAPLTGDPNQFLRASNLGYTARTETDGTIYYTWNRYIQKRDSAYEADLGVRAGYLMLDMPVTEKLRLIGGARYEMTELNANSRSYLANSVTGVTTNSSTIDEGHLLPALGLVYSVSSNMNLRLAYSQTVARPSFRELAAYRSYDPSLDELLDGNPSLLMSEIENYDIRWEWFPRPGELFAVSLFYKELKNAIERRYVTTDGEIISFANRPEATVYGIEFEARKTLDFIDSWFNPFSIGANLSFIESEVTLNREELVARRAVLPGSSDTRALFDQSPYILNVDLSYDNVSSGTSATVLFNVAGPRITIASLNTPDIYEQPTPTLDFIISQRIGRQMKIKFAAKNLLDPAIERTYGKSGSLLYSSYKRGMSFGLSLNYDF